MAVCEFSGTQDYLLRTPWYVPGSGILLDHHEFFHFKALSDVKNPQAEAFTLAHSNAQLITLCNAIRWLARHRIPEVHPPVSRSSGSASIS
ncbi:hypothetical protein Pelo_19927 [Pelomyxa schiedti]|nr:hypothetical protein Pelo_19927 [Pelomyxa schiedti]